MFSILNHSIVRFICPVETSKPGNSRPIVSKTGLVVCAQNTIEAKTRVSPGKGPVRYAEKRAVTPASGYFPFSIFGRGLFVIFYTTHGTYFACLERSRYSTDGKKKTRFSNAVNRGNGRYLRCAETKNQRDVSLAHHSSVSRTFFG